MPVVVTFDRSFLHASDLLSNGNLTITNGSSSGSETSTRSTKSRSTGKVYCEFNFVLVQALSAIGLCNTLQATTTALSNGSNSFGYFSDGNFWRNGVPTAMGASYASGDTVGMAVDLDAKLVWFRKNAGSWLPSGDPALGTGGQAFVVTGPYYYVGAETRLTNDVTIANFGASAYLATAPTNFLNWGVVEPSEILNDDKNRLVYAAEVTTFSVPARN